MPRIIKKDDPQPEINRLKLKTVGLKQSTTNRNKKLKTVLNNCKNSEYNQNSVTQNSYTSKNLKQSESLDSVIYVGSYTLEERYPIIDLTESMTSIKEEKSAIPIRRYPNLLNCRTVYSSLTSLVRNRSLTCTASTTRLMDTLEGPKLTLKTHSKSASCLIVVNDHKHIDKFKTIDIPEQVHLLSSKEKSYIDQVTRLKKEDHDAIKRSLEIGDDINILGSCDPESILSNNVSVEKLMKMYLVKANDDFQ